MTPERARSHAGARRVAVNAVGYAAGGGLTYLLNQARCFDLLGDRWEFTYFVSPSTAEPLREVGSAIRVRVPFQRHPSLTRRVLWEQLELPRILRREPFQLLYAIGGFGVVGSPVPQLVLDQNPYHHATYREIGINRLLLRARIERLAMKLTTRRAEGRVYLTSAYAERMQALGLPAPTDVIPSGVAADWPEALDTLPLDCGKCLEGEFALGVHNWYPHKRLDWLASVWADRQPADDLHLVLVGQPSGRKCDRRLERILRRPDVAACVHRVSGVSRATVAALYRRASLYVSASVLEAFPLTPFEAMSFGVPCVLSDIPTHREVAGDTAVYFEPANAQSLVDALHEAVRDRATLTERTQQRSFPTWSQNVRRFDAEFTRLLEDAKR